MVPLLLVLKMPGQLATIVTIESYISTRVFLIINSSLIPYKAAHIFPNPNHNFVNK